ncbi:EAL domain-containing protein [Cyanobium sp. BA5m-10]|uniref:putative bifunctional diguanylate cyclase/phosphodiesterase n=1 Tax=Cyanobium sp. BA5m-10 TaxID=2823705 RepID=UPI0020CF66E3|nr:EAL domain-containing protein [Cyanobium sp. BA5m-10]MCP9904661.1 EAL domain-containing protein [Cyanobium sp. BA5m-10]
MPQLLSDSAFADAGIPMAFVVPSAERGGLGEIQSANGAMAFFTGRSMEDLTGLAFAELVHRDDVALGEDQLARLSSGQVESCSFEKRFEHADGHRTWGLVTVAEGHDTGGSRQGTWVVQVHDISERKHFVGQLEYFADHDPLTSLFNQRRFRIDVDSQLAYGRRHGCGGAVLMLDLDNFKEVNDQYGHAAGDALIIAVATALSGNSRETDEVSRLGGDEFAVLLPESDLAEAESHAEKLLRAIAAVVVEGAGQGITVAASCGVAGFTTDDGQCADDLLINADLALYQAKESGRGCVKVYHTDSGLHEKVTARLMWSEQIREALDHDGFVLHAKPVIELQTDAIAFYELAIRLRSPGGILIPAAVFLYIAERFGMATDIDEWVTAQAINLLEHTKTKPPLALGINISSASLQGDRFLRFLQSHLAATSFPPELLIFELTEAVAMANLQRARQFGQGLAKLGCRLALDAFGSFYYLKHLPVDLLKIAGEYVRGLGTANDPADHLIIEAVVKLAKGLGTLVVAEFVGDRETRQELLAMGVTLGQGAFLGPSRDVHDIPALQP